MNPIPDPVLTDLTQKALVDGFALGLVFSFASRFGRDVGRAAYLHCRVQARRWWSARPRRS